QHERALHPPEERADRSLRAAAARGGPPLLRGRRPVRPASRGPGRGRGGRRRRPGRAGERPPAPRHRRAFRRLTARLTPPLARKSGRGRIASSRKVQPMPLRLIDDSKKKSATPVIPLTAAVLEGWLEGEAAATQAWVRGNGFTAKPESKLALPDG